MKREDVSKIFENATQEQINELLDLASADIGNAKKKLEAERDNLSAQLQTAKDALKGFEGVDVNELNTKIKNLTDDLTQKEKDYQAKISQMEFSNKLDGLLAKSGAKNSKAVKALLDLETLRSSKNQDADLQSAIEKCKEENDYLFGSDEPFFNPVSASGGTGGSKNTLSGMRAALGLKNEQ